ncbi:tRNA glutamyl-Q(34) synthetase GluQRS [Chitinibacter tainanensis]|uniref:tRNA glutamyl-Q(34) synthetase GluQRS n=1 Tax=Chitinibacter tainanensis TaxID=230667 RepID=UPI00054F34A3|nr:tRNA glutamyl-Q(34) synthetase GluQRS [Chitinibacter tainanensis]
MELILSQGYVGRFAPSPTGLLHMGSLMAAVASFLEARTRGGRWLLRIEDLDPPREMSGAAETFPREMLRFGMQWDGEVIKQSQRHDRYQQVLDELLASQLAYRCSCSRKLLQADGQLGIDGFRYVGRCRDLLVPIDVQHAIRVKVPDEVTSVQDAVQGLIAHNLWRELGDFTVLRADGFWAYQLAVVVDDADCGVTHIVRGADLLDSTTRQCYLQQILGFSTPAYLHIPVITNSSGEKLSKQTLAPALLAENEVLQLWQALYLLWQEPPEYLRKVSLPELWAWAFAHWHAGKMPQKRSVAVTFDEKNEYKFQ